MYLVKNFNLDKDYKDISRTREFKKYDLTVKYANKSFGHCFIDYLCTTIFNSLPIILKKNDTWRKTINIKSLEYKYFF